MYILITVGGTALRRRSNKRSTDLLYDIGERYSVALVILARTDPYGHVSVLVVKHLVVYGAPQNPLGLHASPVLAAYIGSPAETPSQAVSYPPTLAQPRTETI